MSSTGAFISRSGSLLAAAGPDVWSTRPAPPLMLASLSRPSALTRGLIPARYLAWMWRQSWMAAVIRLEGRALLPCLPLLPSSHPKTDSGADTSQGIKLM